MPDAVEVFQVTCPAGTAKASAIEVDISFDPAEVEVIEIHWPAGHASKTGIALALAHQVVIPNTRGNYILGNDQTRLYNTQKYPHTGHWSAFVYNTDVYDHYWQVSFHTALIEPPIPDIFGPPPSIPNEAINMAGVRMAGV